MSEMTEELRLALRCQPIRVRWKARWLLMQLNRAERAYRRSFVGDAGSSLSNYMNGGRTALLYREMEKRHEALAAVTKPILQERVSKG